MDYPVATCRLPMPIFLENVSFECHIPYLSNCDNYRVRRSKNLVQVGKSMKTNHGRYNQHCCRQVSTITLEMAAFMEAKRWNKTLK